MNWRDSLRWTVRVLLLIAVCALQSAAQAPEQTLPHTIAERYLFQSINTERAAAGLAALSWSQPLTIAAQYHVARMRAAGTVSHQFSGEPDVAARASHSGARFSLVAENVATSPSIVQMHTALMNSPHHRDNILDPNANAVGIAVIASGRQLWAVEDFTHVVQEITLDEQEEQVERLLAAAGVPRVTRSDDARATCAMSTGFAGIRPAFVVRYTASDLNRLPSQLTARLTQGDVSGAAVGACVWPDRGDFTAYTIAVVLYR